MSITVREGGFYRRRDGGVVGPATDYRSGLYRWCVGGCSYTESGSYNTEFVDHVFDLIAEVEVRQKLPFELRAGGKYVLDNGEAVELKDSGFSVAEVHKYLPLINPCGTKYGYVSCFGEVLAFAKAEVLAHIVAEYQEPPPSIAARLKKSIELLGTARKDDEAFELIRGAIAELEASK